MNALLTTPSVFLLWSLVSASPLPGTATGKASAPRLCLDRFDGSSCTQMSTQEYQDLLHSREQSVLLGAKSEVLGIALGDLRPTQAEVSAWIHAQTPLWRLAKATCGPWSALQDELAHIDPVKVFGTTAGELAAGGRMGCAKVFASDDGKTWLWLLAPVGRSAHVAGLAETLLWHWLDADARLHVKLVANEIGPSFGGALEHITALSAHRIVVVALSARAEYVLSVVQFDKTGSVRIVDDAIFDARHKMRMAKIAAPCDATSRHKCVSPRHRATAQCRLYFDTHKRAYYWQKSLDNKTPPDISKNAIMPCPATAVAHFVDGTVKLGPGQN